MFWEVRKAAIHALSSQAAEGVTPEKMLRAWRGRDLVLWVSVANLQSTSEGKDRIQKGFVFSSISLSEEWFGIL